MFQAFVIACAASASFEVDASTCIRADDNYGPYEIIEVCGARSIEMYNEINDGALRQYVFDTLGNPPQIYVEAFCETVNSDPAV